MKSINLLILLCLPLFYLLADDENSKSIAVTVYNNNLGVVKDVRTFDLPLGQSIINVTDVASYIDATSVRIKFKGEVIEQNYQYDLVSIDKILGRYIDKQVQMISETGELLEGTLLSVSGSQVVLKKKDGGLMMLPNASKYRFTVGNLPDGLITKPTLKCLFETEKPGKQDVEITYQTSGMNWHTEYVAVLDKDDKIIDLKAWVSIENNSGTSYKNAKLKLIAGDVNKVNEPREDLYLDGGVSETMTKSAPQFEEKSFFEYHIYDLQRPATLANNEIKQISMFENSNIKVTKKYLYTSDGYSSGNEKVAVVIVFDNKSENNMGVPMPKGKVRMYKPDGESLEFIGEDKIDHTPKDERVTLKIGDAFDVVAEESQTDYKQISKYVTEIEYKVVLKNRKKEDVNVSVSRYLGVNWEIMKETFPHTKINSEKIEFNIPVQAGKETELIYKVRYEYQ